jgi:hypothetical protein
MVLHGLIASLYHRAPGARSTVEGICELYFYFCNVVCTIKNLSIYQLIASMLLRKKLLLFDCGYYFNEDNVVNRLTMKMFCVPLGSVPALTVPIRAKVLSSSNVWIAMSCLYYAGNNNMRTPLPFH